MHSVPSFRFYYVAAFLLGALVALLVTAPARAGNVGASTGPGQVTAQAVEIPDAYS
jgi:hypothetical protein